MTDFIGAATPKQRIAVVSAFIAILVFGVVVAWFDEGKENDGADRE